MPEGGKAQFLKREDASEFTQKEYLDLVARKGLESSKNKSIPESAPSKEKHDTEIKLLRFIEKEYKPKEIPMAKRQREMLGLSPREYVLLKGYESYGNVELDKEEQYIERQKILASYKENGAPGMRMKESLLGGAENWLEFMGDVPIYSNREKMVNEFKKLEKDMNYNGISISEKREELGLDPEKFLVATGVLPKQESQSKPDIIA